MAIEKKKTAIKRKRKRKPDSTKIGNRFEKKVYEIFRGELNAGRLLFTPKTAKIFRKKKYWSRDREDNIVVDISIEVSLPDQTDYSLLTVIECKKYSHSVPVDDVEEFNSKLKQIAGANVKGILVSSYSFQTGTVTYARANKIALVRIIDNAHFTWILTRAATGSVPSDHVDPYHISIYRGLTEEIFASDSIDFFSVYSDTFTNSAWKLIGSLYKEILDQDNLSQLWLKEPKKDTIVPFLTQYEIDDTIDHLLSKYGYKGGEVDIEGIQKKIASELDVTIRTVKEIGQDILGAPILGEISFAPKRILIARAPHHTMFSRKFTIAHELGHLLLNHGRYLKREIFSEDQASLSDDQADSAGVRLIDVVDIKYVEWQANHFASALLLPHQQFILAFERLLAQYDVRDRGYGILYLDNQVCNRNTYLLVTNKLREQFRVSRKVVEIRLKGLHLLTDNRDGVTPLSHTKS
jgi:hypothetical protein